MADAWTARSALGTPPGGALFTHGDLAAVSVRELPFQTMLDLRVDPSDAAACDAAALALGFCLPLVPNAAAGTTARRALWMGPDQWLVVTQADEMPCVVAALATLRASVVDVSDLRAVFQLTGPRSADVLRKGCAIDLHPRVFGPDALALTALARVRAIVHQLDRASTYDIYVERSIAGYLQGWLTDAMREYVAPMGQR